MPEREVFHDGTTEAGFYIVYGPGVSEITINSVSGNSNIGLIKVSASNEEATIKIIDEDLTTLPTTLSSPTLEIGGGSFSSKGNSSLTVGQYEITALFAGDTLYNSSSESDSFNLEASQNDNTQLGTGALVNVVADSGTGYTGTVCSNDADNDGICSGWDKNGIQFGVDGKKNYIDLPARDDNKPNIYIEIDYMKDHKPRSNAVQDLIDVFDQNGISLTVFIDEEIPHVDTLHIWTDNDSDSTNDYDSIKANHYGTISERPSATGQTTSISSQGSTQKTLTLQNIKVSTPSYPPRIIQDPTLPIDSTQGTVTIKSKITTSNPVILSVPSNLPVPSTGPDLNIYASPTASVLPIPGTEHIVTVEVKFKTTGAITNVDLGTIDVPITLSSSATVNAQTYPNSPFASSTLIEAYAQVVRYMIFAHSSGGPSGTSEFLGNDAAITLGEGFGGTISGHSGSTGTRNEQSGTMLHEIGHWLGLKHGGPEKIGTTIVADADINCKPIHTSVMSYSRQTPAYLGGTWTLDFSHGNLHPLTEGTLNEQIGFLTDGPATTQVYATPSKLVKKYLSYSSGPAVKVDFDGNGVFDNSPVSVDINNFGIPGCNTSQISTSAYYDYDEWSNLKYNFRDTVSGQFDGASGNHPTPNGDLNYENYQLQILQGFQFNGANPPPSTDGTEIRNKGSTLPLKIPIFDSMGNTIDFAKIYAEYTVGSSTTKNLVKDSSKNSLFTYSGGFYSINWQTPKKAGVYYITAYIKNPVDSGEDWPIINEDLEPQLINPAGQIVTFKVTLE